MEDRHDAPLWTPDEGRRRDAIQSRFRSWLARTGRGSFADYAQLYRWSVEHRAQFWSSLWEFTEVIPGDPGTPPFLEGDLMPGARWFPRARLNFAENLLRRTDSVPAVIYRGENGTRRELSGAQLCALVSRLMAALEHAGIEAGDRVAAIAANTPETLAAMLATTAVGAVWSSCSPDFGVDGILARFAQISPRLLFAATGHDYKGKHHDGTRRLEGILAGLPSVERAVLLPHPADAPAAAAPATAGAITMEDFLAPFEPGRLRFRRYPFDHPLYILFSSGTTGKPKCIVHGAGGTLLQHLKEHQLHSDIKPGDRVFYFTTCGWMMWNWLVSALASGATLVLYDGSPFHPSEAALFDLAQEEAVTHFGISARYVDAVSKSAVRPRESHRLEKLRVILSTGSPLSPEAFRFVYRHIKEDVQLASISGGTDIVSCFALGNPTGPVWAGELQARGLGMKVAVFDDDGREVTGQKGELVCTAPFPSMPLRFWNDPDGTRYREAYLARYPGVWHHGDYAELTPHGGMILHGRSDATLNPGGVRVGTAEIYRQVERFEEVLESLAVEQRVGDTGRVVLFVKLRSGCDLTEDLAGRIRSSVRTHTTAHHVPEKIIQVADLPRTKSGKLSELAVRSALHGLPVANLEALENPEVMDRFRDMPELADGR